MTHATQNTKPQTATQNKVSSMQVVPFTQESEEALLGAMLLTPSILPTVARRVIAEDFFLVRHTYIFRAMENLYKDDQTFDYVTLSEYLRNKGVLDEVGGQGFLIHLVNQTPTAMNAEIYAELIARAATRRRMLIATDSIRKLALDESTPLADVIAQSEKALSVSTIDFAKRQEEFWLDIVMSETDKHMSPEKYLNVGVQLEFPLQSVRLKLQAEEVTMLAGLTGTGKTAFALWLMLYHLKRGRRVVFISLEMTKRKILFRLAAILTGVSAEEIENRTYPVAYRMKVVKAIRDLGDYADQFIVVENARTDKTINRAVASIAYGQDVDLVVVDHLMRVGLDNSHAKEYERLKAVSEEFQAQAKEYKCPYLLLHQLKLPPPDRKDKTPFGNDLYGGNYVEQIVDNVYALHRDDHSKLDIADAIPGQVALFKLKDRNGGSNTRELSGYMRYLGNERYAKWGV